MEDLTLKNPKTNVAYGIHLNLGNMWEQFREKILTTLRESEVKDKFEVAFTIDGNVRTFTLEQLEEFYLTGAPYIPEEKGEEESVNHI